VVAPSLEIGDGRKGKTCFLRAGHKKWRKVRLGWVSASKPSLALDHLQGYIEEHYFTMVAPSSKISN